MEIVKRLDFTLLITKNYLYMNKLAPKDLALDEFKAKNQLEVWFRKTPSFNKLERIQLYQNNLLINRSNAIVWTAVLFFSVLI